MQNPSNEYLRNAVMTATPEQLQLMLYDGAIRFTRQAIEGLKKGNWEEAFNGFSRSQRIVLELLSSLNYDVDRALCTKMAGLYNFIYRRLVEASMQRSQTIGEEALRLLEYQRETWVMLLEKLRAETSGAPPARAAQPASPPVVVVAESEDEVYGTLSLQG